MSEKSVPWGGLALCASAGWYGVIWNFSAQTGTSSGGLSDRLLGWLLETFVPAWRGAAASAQADAVDTLSFFLRKGAHMTCYFILAALLLAACSSFGMKRWKKVCLVLLSCAGLAGLDEYHQTFVQGRSGALSDVGIDLIGAASAAAVCLLLEWAVDGERQPLRLPRTAWAAGGLAAVGGALLPALLTGEPGSRLCRRLCVCFLQRWSAMPDTEQAAFTAWLAPVAAQAAQLLLAAAVGAAAGLCRRRYDLPLPAALAVVTLWGAAAALPAGGSPLWGGCAALLGFLLITAGILTAGMYKISSKIE